MTDRSSLPAGVPHLLDQYKQRRQAWLDQADELARLRDEVRMAAEREALDIVTAARRDVRRIVVEARRELLVLTAQLHASIESADQAFLEAANHQGSEAASVAAQLDAAGSLEALASTRDAVLGARREVRSVLDEARAEIEALAAEARAPIHEAQVSLPPSPLEPPIPTLAAILGSDPLTRAAAPALVEARSIERQTAGSLSGEWPHAGTEPTLPDLPMIVAPTPAPAPLATTPVGAPASQVSPATAPSVAAQAIASQPGVAAQPGTMRPQPVPTRDSEVSARAAGETVSFVLAPDADAVLDGFNKRDSDEPFASPLETFGDTDPVHAPETRTTFLDDYDRAPRSRPMWAWVAIVGGTGVLLLGGAAWWAQAREARSTQLASIATNPTTPGAADKPGARVSDTAAGPAPAAAAPAAPGVAIEVRRTAWLRAVVDGKEDSRVYKAGETRNIVGARTVSLRAGDGGAVFVAVDGRPAEALGISGTAVTRQYSPAGPAVAAAPAPVPSPAATANTADTPPATIPSGSPVTVAPPATPRTADAPAPGPAPQPAGRGPANEGTVSAAPISAGRADLVSAGQQWLDAYQRRDWDGMGAAGIDNVTISDERTLTERFPAWQTGIRRDLDQVELELTGDTALLTARMTERSGDTATTSGQHVSRISQIWVRRNGRWRVADVRIMGEGRLNQIVR